MKQLNNIITTQYYNDFRNGNKTLCLCFYYNCRFGDGNYNSDFVFPQSNSKKVLLHLNLLLDFYINNQFKCNININDELWLSDLRYRDKIIDIFIEKFSSTKYKPKEITIYLNAVWCLNKQSIWFIHLINKFNKIGIQIKLNVETILIDIVNIDFLLNIKDFLLNYTNKLKIKINPNNFAYFIEIFDQLYMNFQPILYLYEEDNVNWTDYKINEYIEFLDKYIDKIYKEYSNDILFLEDLFVNNQLNLISLQKSCNKCSFFQSLNILLEDLSIILCPKFHYSNEIIGYYIVKDQKITSIEAKKLTNIYEKDKDICNSCVFVNFCKGFCRKESFRHSLISSNRIKESCEMKRAKYAFLFFKLQKLNILTIENLKQISNIDLNYTQDILKIYANIVQRI